MKYALLVYNDADNVDRLPADQLAAMRSAYDAIDALPGFVQRLRLKESTTATTVRVHGQQTLVTDGPFADTKEVFGGIFVFEAENLDAVIDIAARIPSAALGGCVEIRPVYQ